MNYTPHSSRSPWWEVLSAPHSTRKHPHTRSQRTREDHQSKLPRFLHQIAQNHHTYYVFEGSHFSFLAHRSRISIPHHIETVFILMTTFDGTIGISEESQLLRIHRLECCQHLLQSGIGGLPHYLDIDSILLWRHWPTLPLKETFTSYLWFGARCYSRKQNS